MCKNTVSYHEFKEKPGLLQSALPDASTAHHPLEGQLLMEELSRAGEQKTETKEVERERQKGRGNKARQRECEAPGEVLLSIFN